MPTTCFTYSGSGMTARSSVKTQYSLLQVIKIGLYIFEIRKRQVIIILLISCDRS